MSTRTHFRGYPHGQGRSRRWSLLPAEVDCRVCVKRLWRDAALAHFRLFGAGDTEFGRRMRRATREAEAATRG